MKNAALLFILSIFCNSIWGQNQEKAEILVDEGIAYHDKGDYEAAIRKYDQALELDKDNLLALAEKAMTLLSLQKYEETIEYCQTAIDKHPGEKNLQNVYVTCGTAYDGLQKTEKSIEMYDKGIKLFPNYYQLPFNKGITLFNAHNYEEAVICFQKSATLNSQHASSQNALARILTIQNKRIPAILAFSRFLIIEPQTNRAKENLGLLLNIIKANIEQTDENSITINRVLLVDTTTEGKVKENSFVSTDLILSFDAALDYGQENKHKTEVEKFIRKFETICASLKETQGKNYGFYWDYYVPYFVEMNDKNFVETFAYIAFATADNPEVNQWLNAHDKEIEDFYGWSGNYSWTTK